MACQHVEDKIIGSPGPGRFCDDPGGLNNLRRQRKYKKKSRQVLEDQEESQNVLRVRHG